MKTYTAKHALSSLIVSVEARLKFDRADYWEAELKNLQEVNTKIGNELKNQGCI